jgi:triacylglycerol esterase/lipase EstA (alpha/beta hydrolase family)
VLAAVVTVLRVRDPDVAQGDPGTVLLVEGYGGSSRSLEVLERRLRAAGRTAEVVPPVGDNTGDLRAQARQLDAAARRAIASGAPSVDVVGYSAGGVVARLWVAELGGDDLARRVVTLGSPHHGTQVAGFAAGLSPGSCPVACQELAPGSDLLRSLPEAPRGPRWTSIWTSDDETVVPPDSARLSGGVSVELQQVCADARVAHGNLPADPLTTGLVKLALGVAPLDEVPARSRCAALRAAGTSSGGQAVSS